jgi:hypothetical protein
MTNRRTENIARRDVLRLFTAGAAVAAMGTASCARSAEGSENDPDRSRARYQPSSPDVQNFYRVNRYPEVRSC